MRQTTARQEHGRSPPRPAGSGQACRGREERDGDHEIGQIAGDEMNGEDAREEPGEQPRLLLAAGGTRTSAADAAPTATPSADASPAVTAETFRRSAPASAATSAGAPGRLPTIERPSLAPTRVHQR